MSYEIELVDGSIFSDKVLPTFAVKAKRPLALGGCSVSVSNLSAVRAAPETCGCLIEGRLFVNRQMATSPGGFPAFLSPSVKLGASVHFRVDTRLAEFVDAVSRARQFTPRQRSEMLRAALWLGLSTLHTLTLNVQLLDFSLELAEAGK